MLRRRFGGCLQILGWRNECFRSLQNRVAPNLVGAWA
jgi:hypothetical protein